MEATRCLVLSVGPRGAMFVLGAVPIGAAADRVRRTGVVAGKRRRHGPRWCLPPDFVRHTFWMFVARTGTGLGQSNVLPVHNALLADGFPIEVRGRLFALNGLASPIGQAAAPAAVGAIAAIAGGADGWRWVFWMVPIPALVLAVGPHGFRRIRREERTNNGRFLGSILDEDEGANSGVDGQRFCSPEQDQDLSLHAARHRRARIRSCSASRCFSTSFSRIGTV